MIAGLLSAAVRAARLPFPVGHRISIWLGYARIRVKHALGRRPTSERYLGMHFDFNDYGTFAYLIEEMFISGQYALGQVDPPRRIVDGGSNIGVSVAFFRWCYPQASILAFEPDPGTADLLERNITLNGIEGVEVHRVALSGSDGQVSFERGVGGAGSVASHIADRAAGDETITVPTRRLSPFLEGGVDLLKLDIEGAEGSCLAEAATSGALAGVRRMVIECHHQPGGVSTLTEVADLLDEHGFRYRLAVPGRHSNWSEGRQDVLVYAWAGGKDEG